MNCPICGHGEHRVLRTDAMDSRVRRTRECLKCGHRWRTLEVSEQVIRRADEIAETWRAMSRAIGGE